MRRQCMQRFARNTVGVIRLREWETERKREREIRMRRRRRRRTRKGRSACACVYTREYVYTLVYVFPNNRNGRERRTERQKGSTTGGTEGKKSIWRTYGDRAAAVSALIIIIHANNNTYNMILLLAVCLYCVPIRPARTLSGWDYSARARASTTNKYTLRYTSYYAHIRALLTHAST